MAEISEQLALLRQKVAAINRKYAENPTGLSVPALPMHSDAIDKVLSGAVVQSHCGAHFETEKWFARWRRHGSVDISDLIELPPSLLSAISGAAVADVAPERWAFLDTETTGLAAGSGTYAFLIGIGSIEKEGFRVRQFFLRQHQDEPSQLAAVSDYLQRFEVLITYNGRSYDQPLLETRYRMCRIRNPLGRMEHVDLLFGARRLWKLRLANCRLTHLENAILGVERQGDLPGEMIPHYYFDYIRTQRAANLVPIFHHNAMDILTLACLTALVPRAFVAPEKMTVQNGSDLIGLGRWLSAAGRVGEAIALLRRAIDIGLPDHLLFRTILDVGLLEKKRKNEAAARTAFSEVATGPNPWRSRALEELAKYYEHREKNRALALEFTRSALSGVESPALRKREARLSKRVDSTRSLI